MSAIITELPFTILAEKLWTAYFVTISLKRSKELYMDLWINTMEQQELGSLPMNGLRNTMAFIHKDGQKIVLIL